MQITVCRSRMRVGEIITRHIIVWPCIQAPVCPHKTRRSDNMRPLDCKSVPLQITRELRAYSRAIECQDASAIAKAHAPARGRIDGLSSSSLPTLLSKFAGFPLRDNSKLHHEFVIYDITPSNEGTEVTARAEIDVQCADGNMLLGVLPAQISLTASGEHTHVNKVVYDFGGIDVKRLAGWGPMEDGLLMSYVWQHMAVSLCRQPPCCGAQSFS